jgi:hypothetical protein
MAGEREDNGNDDYKGRILQNISCEGPRAGVTGAGSLTPVRGLSPGSGSVLWPIILCQRLLSSALAILEQSRYERSQSCFIDICCLVS